MQESIVSRISCITVFSEVSRVILGETRGSNVTYVGRSNFSNADSWYEGESAFHRDRFSPPPEGEGLYCRHPAKCERLNYTTCMGVKLPYGSTTLELVGDSSSQEQIQVCSSCRFRVCIKFSVATAGPCHFSLACCMHVFILSELEHVGGNHTGSNFLVALVNPEISISIYKSACNNCI
jgi:hypothetical protein